MSDVRKQEPDRMAPAGVPGFEQLFRQAAPGLWRTIFAFAGGRAAVADDAVAEAFARALERVGQIREPVPWLYRTAFRIAAGELRRKEPAAGPEPGVAAAAGLEALVPALRELSTAQRAAVVLHYEADLPVREVAERMGTSVAAVKVHLFRARRRLRELLTEEEAGHA